MVFFLLDKDSVDVGLEITFASSDKKWLTVVIAIEQGGLMIHLRYLLGR